MLEIQPILAHANTVRCRSEPLDEIWWQGRQWAVTRFGIECRDGTYVIAANRLYERNYHEGTLAWCWLLHMAEKNWIDIHDFCTAFTVALSLHARPPKAKPFERGEVQQACSAAIKRVRSYGIAA